MYAFVSLCFPFISSEFRVLKHALSKFIQTVTIQTCIQEVIEVLLWFCSDPPNKILKYFKIGHNLKLATIGSFLRPFQFVIHFHEVIQCYISSVTGSVIK
jgi:hypothetical protein